MAAEAAEATAVVDEAVSPIVMTNTLPFPTSVTVTRPIAPATSSVARPTVGEAVARKAGRGVAAVALTVPREAGSGVVAADLPITGEGEISGTTKPVLRTGLTLPGSAGAGLVEIAISETVPTAAWPSSKITGTVVCLITGPYDYHICPDDISFLSKIHSRLPLRCLN